MKAGGLFEGMMPGFVKNRRVGNLCPNAPLAQDFVSGGKPLVPGIFIHGVGFSAEEYYATPMILASHGYFMVSPTMMDGSAPHTLDKNNNDVWYRDLHVNGSMKNADGTESLATMNTLNEMID